ncbi:MAG: aldehyde dehydrogenase family protein, partial [Sphingobacteriales bacterium]
MATDFAPQLQEMKAYFDSGATQSYAFRIEQLKRLNAAIVLHEREIAEALFQDLHKSEEEVWVTETGLVLNELNFAIRKLRSWMKPQRVSTNLLNFPSRSSVLAEPHGVVLIISPWNYPFQLLFSPLVGALAAGNCVVLKPSEFAPHTAAVMGRIIADVFQPQHVCYVEGEGHEVIPALMNKFTFNYVFYTGGTAVGKAIYKMAADKLTPVTLELGGKSPCVVSAHADLKVAAKRIAFAKFSNAGQMCVAPDYVLVHESVKAQFVDLFTQTITGFFGADPAQHENFGRIINA